MELLNIESDEDALIEKLKEITDFRFVESIGRKDKPSALQYPCAFIYWFGDSSVQNKPRQVVTRKFHVLIYQRNFRGENHAADNSYSLVEAVYEKLSGFKTLEYSENLNCNSITIADYDAGVISYQMEFSAKRYINRIN